MGIYRLGTKAPVVPRSAYVAESAWVIGNVTLHDGCSVWFEAVVRGDNGSITIGARSNVQDGAILHTTPGQRLMIGEGVTVGHQAMLHGCEIGHGALIGIGAVVLDGAVIGERCLVGAGAVVTPGTRVPPESLVLGSPARVVRVLRLAELERLARNADRYVEDASTYQHELERLDAPAAHARVLGASPGGRPMRAKERALAAVNSAFGALGLYHDPAPPSTPEARVSTFGKR